MWGIPAVVAVATVGVVTVGVVGGGAGGGRGSVAACSAPADSACAPAAAGVPVVIPVVNDWPNDCGDNGAVAAAGGMPAAGTDGPPTPTAGALGVGVVRRYPVGVGRAAWEQCRMVMLVLELSAGRYLLKMNLAPWEQCRMVMLVLELSAGRWLSSNDWAQTEQHRMGILQASSPS